MEDPINLDFSPFDGQSNLKAVCDVVKTIRQLSWTYAGDIERAARKLAMTFDAQRCVVFVNNEDSADLGIFEFHRESLQKVRPFFETPEGKSFVYQWMESSEDCTTLVDQMGAESWPDAMKELEHPPSFLFPIPKRHNSRLASKPGLLLLQEAKGLARWNQLVVTSLIVLADYLGMVIECDAAENRVR
ncbi:MAG: hypothetical protein K2Z81_13160 [Cyanobacteria bacterium]|nr:hypothetical protein [Cyanobacteriota bacterium]